MDARTRDRVPPPRPSSLQQSQGNQTDFKTMQTYHDKAYKHIEKGLAGDESENVDNAISNYRSGLEFLDRALAVDCEQLVVSEDKKDTAKQMQQKMTKTKLQIEYRLQSMEVQRNVHSRHPLTPMDLNQPPSYEDVMSESGSSLSDTAFQSLGDSVMSDNFDSSELFEADATEIYCIPDGVQIFFITPEGYVSAPTYPSSLKMFKFTSEPSVASVHERPPAFLQVNSWIYPLQPGASPALRASNGAYIFPDTSERPGSAVGLMLPETMSSAEKETFESVLSAMTVMQQQQVEERREPTAPPREREVIPPPAEMEPEVEEEDKSTSAKISKGIAIASSWVSWGIEKGAEKAGHYIRVGSVKIKEKMKAREKDTEVDPRIQQGVQYVRRGTHVAVKVSSYVIKKLGEATMAVGKEVAPVIRKQGEKLLPESVKGKSSDGKSKVDGILDVAGAGLIGFSTVYMTLEAAAKALGKNIANETVNLVDHKYGSHAGQLAENGLYAIGNTVLTVNNVDNLGIKAVAKRAAKDTGKALVTDINLSRNDKSTVNYNGQSVEVTQSKKS